MIPSNCFTMNPDGTAWLAFSDNEHNDAAFQWDKLDRPCDNRFTHDDTWDCPDCINGRHTWVLDVECPTYTDTHAGNAKHGTGACEQGGCRNGVRSLRVSVVPGMVLPIVDQEDGCPDTPHVCVFHGRMGGEPHNQWTLFGADGMEDELDPFPSDAKPGGWAVQVQVAS